MVRHCIVCNKLLVSTNHSNYCGIHHKDSSIAIVLQEGEIAVKKAKIDAIIEFVSNTGLYAEQNIRNKIIRDLQELLK